MSEAAIALATEAIANRIATLRGQRVIVDADLAALYGVPTKRLNEQVRRNAERFPDDFMFQLSDEEFESLRSQFATSNQTPSQRGGRRYAPLVFTEHGAIMAATVLNSPRAVEVSIYVVRAFVRLREVLASNKDLAVKLGELERKLKGHDQTIVGILNAIRQLMAPPPDPPRRSIDFVPPQERKRSDKP